MKSILCLCVVITLSGLNLASGCPASCICNYNEGSVHCKGREDFFNHTEIPDNFTSVVYEDCRLGTISDKLLYVHTVSLSIRNSGLSNINNEVFAGMTALKTLDLRYNNLSAFSEDVFSGLDSLQDLYLSYNHFTTLLPNFFAHLPTLVHVQLDGNRGFQFSSSMFGNVENTSNLTHISCASCDIAEISAATEALSKVTTLRDLNLSSNRLTSLPPRIFEANQRLETLRLDNCWIKNVSEGSFAGLIHLRKLNLSMNKIQNLPTGLFDVSKKSLRFVFLDSNALTTLDENLLEWSSLSELQLENNSWTCDCDIEWLRQLQIDLTNVTCAKPASVQGSSVKSYPVSCSDKGSQAVVLAIVIPIILICLAVIGCFLYRFMQTVIIRRRRERQKSSVRYSAVYKDTVEPASSQQQYRLKQDSHI